MQQINIVISGFTPYEGIDVNPAVLVPAAVAKQWADPAQSQAISEELLQDIAVTVTNVTLPVSFAKAWPTLLEAIEQAKPDIVIATGLKRTSRGILLERCATNLMDAAKPDADNVIPPRRPIDPEGHPHVTQFSRAYVRHLFKAGEILALRLLSFQNLEFYLRLMAQAREAIAAGTFGSFKDSFIARYKANDIL